MKEMWIFGRNKQSQIWINPNREPVVWILKCSETSGVDRRDESRHRSRLWRDRQELAGSLRCHIHQPWPSGTGWSVAKKKLHISEYVYVDACSGSESLNLYWHVEPKTQYSITVSDTSGIGGTATHFVVEKAIKAIIGTKLFLWRAKRIFLTVCVCEAEGEGW